MPELHTVYHPRLPGVIRSGLTDEQRESHKASGWRMTPPLPEKAGGEPERPRSSAKKNVIETPSEDDQ